MMTTAETRTSALKKEDDVFLEDDENDDEGFEFEEATDVLYKFGDIIRCTAMVLQRNRWIIVSCRPPPP